MTEREFQYACEELSDENRTQRAVIRQLQKDIDGLRRLIAELVSALSKPAPRGWHGIQDPNQDLIARAQQEARVPK
jgi:hypothetical protein